MQPRRLFTYGCLMEPELMRALLGRALPSRPATLDGFGRYALHGRPYPGLVAEPTGRTEGVVYGELDAEGLTLLDHFEGELYARRSVRVQGGDGGELEAETYVLLDAHRSVLADRPWDAARFFALHLEDYREHCATLRARLAGPTPLRRLERHSLPGEPD